jgi:uncharacterized protein involved in exopolysaccharide biosynthesis
MPEELSLVRRSRAVASPTLRDLAAILFRQRSIFVISFAVVFLGISLYGVLVPSYSAEMKVLVRRGRIDPLASPAPTNVAFERREVSEEDLNSEVELLRDHDLLRNVVRTANLSPPAQTWWDYGTTEQRQERAVRRLAGKLKVSGVRKTNLITVGYASSNPAEASAVLRALSAAYIERHQRLQRPSGEFSFFEQEADQARVTLEQAELALMEFTHRNSVVDAPLQRDATLQKLTELQASSSQAAIQIEETAQRARDLQAKLDSSPARMTTQVRISDNPQLLEKLKSRLLELQLKRTELLTKFLPSYRLVQEVDQQIAETKQAITTEELTPLRDETTDQDPTHEWTRAELLKAQVDLDSLHSRAAAINTVVSAYRQTAQQFGDRAIQQDALLRNLKTAEQKYLLYENKREEARIGDAMDSGGILDVTIAELPTVPALPTHSLSFVVLFGLIVAGGSGTGLAFVADYTSPAFRTPEEVTSYLDVPVLASLPSRCEVHS